MESVTIDSYEETRLELIRGLSRNVSRPDLKSTVLKVPAPKDKQFEVLLARAPQVILGLRDHSSRHDKGIDHTEIHAGGSNCENPTICGTRFTLYPLSGRTP